MHWSLAGKTDAELLQLLQAENFAMANMPQTQAQRARSALRCNQLTQARTMLRREARHEKFRMRMRAIAEKQERTAPEAGR